jgi:hypothetical protein
MNTAFTAQNGFALHQATTISVTGCPKKANSKKATKVRKGRANTHRKEYAAGEMSRPGTLPHASRSDHNGRETCERPVDEARLGSPASSGAWW